jgi:hypothetical protein
MADIAWAYHVLVNCIFGSEPAIAGLTFERGSPMSHHIHMVGILLSRIP